MINSYFTVFGANDPDHDIDAVFTKDDSSHQTITTYYVLLGCFTGLAIMGLVNICLALTIRKFSKPIVTFYLVTLTVIVMRMLLFADPLIDYSDSVYVVILVSMPSYLYLLVGLSQVMLTLESIIKYKNFKIREKETLTESDFKAKIKKNQRFLDISYLILYCFFFIIVAFFVGAFFYCVESKCNFEGSYFGPLYLAAMNLIVWIMLIWTTCSFVRMLNKRFGETEFTGPKC